MLLNPHRAGRMPTIVVVVSEALVVVVIELVFLTGLTGSTGLWTDGELSEITGFFDFA